MIYRQGRLSGAWWVGLPGEGAFCILTDSVSGAVELVCPCVWVCGTVPVVGLSRRES